jgi:hypothetical protein
MKTFYVTLFEEFRRKPWVELNKWYFDSLSDAIRPA